MIHHQYGKQAEQIDDGKPEGGHRQPIVGGEVQAHRVVEKPSAQADRAEQIQATAHPDQIGQQCNRKQQDGIEQNMQPGKLHPVSDRQHGNGGLGIFLAAMDGQRPEMRRRPDEDNQKQAAALPVAPDR